MNDTPLMQISMRNLDWLNARQALISANVANAHTPGFQTRDVKPFSETLDMVSITPSATSGGHMTLDASLSPAVGDSRDTSWETFHSGGNVSLEHEMVKASEVSEAYRLNTSIMRTFHTLFLTMAS